MTRYFISRQAAKDLEEIHDFVAQDSPKAATRLLDLLQSKCRMLAASPGLGRRRDEIVPLLRSFPVSSYVVFYRQTSEGIEIIRILHGARDIGTIL